MEHPLQQQNFQLATRSPLKPPLLAPYYLESIALAISIAHNSIPFALLRITKLPIHSRRMLKRNFFSLLIINLLSCLYIYIITFNIF